LASNALIPSKQTIVELSIFTLKFILLPCVCEVKKQTFHFTAKSRPK
jgi:hypothetical protein